MATASGPDLAPTGASPAPIVEDASCTLPAGTQESTPISSPREPSSLPDLRPGNPTFIFPPQPPSLPSSPLSTFCLSSRRPMSAIESRMTDSSITPENADRPRRPMALPAFSFNPGAALLTDPDSLPFLSPPLSPHSVRTFAPSSRPAGHGHRRGGSEFVGGSIRDGNSIAVMGASPTKSDSGFSSPGLAPPKRGHRRGISGTISVSDLPQLDSMMPRGGSAPSSPTTLTSTDAPPMPFRDGPTYLLEPAQILESSKRPNDAAQPPGLPTTPTSPSSDAEAAPLRHARPARARVGFSDRLEFIPRPLSLVSSDTSSTATARPGHSVSGSISSIMSAASPSGGETAASLARSPARDNSRPSTAGAILERTMEFAIPEVAGASPKRRNSIPTLLNIADAQSLASATTAPTTKTSKRWSFFGLESPFLLSAAPTRRRSSSSSSSESGAKAVSGTSSSDLESDSTETGRDGAAASTKAMKKASKKKKVKGWAGSILPLKPRGPKKRTNLGDARPPTPPASVGPCDDGDEENRPAAEAGGPAVASKESPPAMDKPTPKESPRFGEDASHLMIDLDAALGPFNTPLPQNPEWDAAQRAAGNPGKRRLHSAQGLKGFSGPGMHYHRRTESAPDLPPFDAAGAGIHRFGSNSTMADVFEEEEEDDNGAATAASSSEANLEDTIAATSCDDASDDGEMTPPAGGPEVDGTSSSEAAAGPRRPDAWPSEGEKAAGQMTAAGCSKTSLPDEVAAQEPPSIIFRSANLFYGAPDSTVSSPGKALSPTDFGPSFVGNSATAPTSPYSTSYASSSHPSPRSPMSMMPNRVSTAPSSVMDENSFQSLLMGEPGPEVRISVDYDIPSLTSSNSTMTRDSAFAPHARTSQPSLREQRPVSVSSAAFGRRRSSLVSLSRLISSSHGERSKLSMEMTLDNESDNRRSMGSKTKQRLGRMMQFWKANNSNNKDGALS
ncbi:cell wall proline rich protein [Drechmeria coniospora]|uniref:Cell wall proline rich protein n=1 Tax=Drechmeria coniospora TaxID=98403 RepID=A0A151GMG8_DRECN|nr:cell wall proline rich protein [Drechmeria coniospora]KYK58221.1 cell wall proline rich protein [Drechmeria coniospora]